MYPEPIQKLIKNFSKLPTVGPRTAARFVFHLIRNKEDIDELSELLTNLSKEVKFCSFCFKPFEGSSHLCEICSNPSRDRTKICIVERETDLESIEKIKKYKGLYFILGGTVSLLKKDKSKIRVDELIERIKDPVPFHLFNADIKELIIATNLNSEGQATALFLETKLKSLNKKITKLGRGMPSGGELEYADEDTLGEALEGRK